MAIIKLWFTVSLELSVRVGKEFPEFNYINCPLAGVRHHQIGAKSYRLWSDQFTGSRHKM